MDFSSLSPDSLLVGILIGFLVTVIAVLLGAVVFAPRKPKTVEEKPYFDPKMALDRAAKLSVPAKTVVVGVRTAAPSVSIGVARKVEPASIPIPAVTAPAPVQVGAVGKKGINPFAPHFRYVGKQTYATLREALAAEFPAVLTAWNGRTLEYTKMPAEVRQAITREKLARGDAQQ